MSHVNPWSRELESRRRIRGAGVENVLFECGRRVQEKLAVLRQRQDDRLRKAANVPKVSAKSRELAERREARLRESSTDRLWKSPQRCNPPPAVSAPGMPSAKSSTKLLRSKYGGKIPPMRQRVNNWISGVKERRAKAVAEEESRAESELANYFQPQLATCDYQSEHISRRSGDVFTRGQALTRQKEAWRSEQLRLQRDEELKECTHVPSTSASALPNSRRTGRTQGAARRSEY